MKNELSRRGNYGDYDFFEDAMRDFFPSFYRRGEGHKYMRTDIKENEKDYEMEIELPGMEKSDIAIDLEDGYLSISAGKSEKQSSDKGNYIRRERSFSCSRSYYVGDVNKEDIKAKYENGILTIVIPKEEPKKSSSSRIDIE